MSDTTTEPQAQAQGDPEELGDAGRRALRAERERANTAERRVAELETQVSTLTAEHETALAAANQAAEDERSRADRAEGDTLRYRVALETGVPARHIGRLQGDTEEALREDAAAFVADITPGPTTPKPDLSQGPKGDTVKPSTAQQFADQLGDF